MKKTGLKPSYWMSSLALICCLLLPVAAGAEGASLAEATLEYRAAEVEHFVAALEGLDAKLDLALLSLVDSGRELLAAVERGDEEAFLAARAVFQHRRETLPAASMALWRDLASVQTVDATLSGGNPGAPGDKVISTSYGCAVELPCNNAAPISCRCANGQAFNTAASECRYKPNFNSFGGRVECDCSGTLFDQFINCPSGGGGGGGGGSCNNNRECTLQCGPIGGTCLNGQCICH